MSDKVSEKVYEVAVPFGICKIKIEGVGRGSAWIEGPDGVVTVNRIPHVVHPTPWNRVWDGTYRAGRQYDIRRTDTSYPEGTTYNAYDKITSVISEAVTKVAEAEGANFDHLGRLAELESAKYVHEATAKNLRAQAADLIKKAELEEGAVEQLDAAIYFTLEEQPGQFEQSVSERFENGAETARTDIANLGGSPEGEETLGIWDLQKAAETKLRAIEKATPVAHIAHGGMVAYYRGYLKTCSDTIDAYWQRVRERERAAAGVR